MRLGKVRRLESAFPESRDATLRQPFSAGVHFSRALYHLYVVIDCVKVIAPGMPALTARRTLAASSASGVTWKATTCRGRMNCWIVRRPSSLVAIQSGTKATSILAVSRRNGANASALPSVSPTWSKRRPPSSTIGFGLTSVSSDSRLPRPPARMTTFSMRSALPQKVA